MKLETSYLDTLPINKSNEWHPIWWSITNSGSTFKVPTPAFYTNHNLSDMLDLYGIK